jgi:hypothetical protein
MGLMPTLLILLTSGVGAMKFAGRDDTPWPG